MDALNLSCLIISVCLLAGYHLSFVYQIKKEKSSVLSGWLWLVRERWVLETSKKKSGDILAVQTLRNWIIAATFLATVSITISFGLLSFLVQISKESGSSRQSTGSAIDQFVIDPLLTPKTIIILCFNFLSFFFFSQSIRIFCHVGFAMCVPFSDHHEKDNLGIQETVKHVSSILNSGARFFTLGIRSSYLGIPFVFWYFGPIALLVASCITVFFIWFGDNSLGAQRIRSNELSMVTAEKRSKEFPTELLGPSSSSDIVMKISRGNE